MDDLNSVSERVEKFVQERKSPLEGRFRGGDMFYGASPTVFGNAKELRSNMTLAEQKLWDRLSKKQIMGMKFRRQHPIGGYVADFYCHAAQLAIEVDGKHHEDKRQEEHDERRTLDLEELGIKVARFRNEEIFKNMDEVLEKITVLVKERAPESQR